MEVFYSKLIESLKSSRWFQDKNSSIENIEIIDWWQFMPNSPKLVLLSINKQKCFYLLFLHKNNEPITEDKQLFQQFFQEIKNKKVLDSQFGKIVLLGPSDEVINLNSFEKFGEDSTNSLFAAGQLSLIKIFRKVESGQHPEEILLRALSDCSLTPKLKSAIHWNLQGKEIVIALEQEMVQNNGSAWSWLVTKLKNTKEPQSQKIQTFFSSLGRGLADFHNSIFEMNRMEASLKVEAMNICDLEKLIEQIEALHKENEELHLIDEKKLLLYVLEQKNKIMQLGIKLKTHGDFHLGQVLCTDNNFKIIDFEGQPIYSLEERWKLNSPLQDVASLVRSIEYLEKIVEWKEADFFIELKQTFINSYCENVKFELPQSFEALFNLQRLCKIYQELNYEKRVRPDMMWICVNALKDELEPTN